jgi:hypothetical protein
MNDSVRKSCWGITAWAVAGFSGILLLAIMFGASEVATVVAAG